MSNLGLLFQCDTNSIHCFCRIYTPLKDFPLYFLEHLGIEKENFTYTTKTQQISFCQIRNIEQSMKS